MRLDNGEPSALLVFAILLELSSGAFIDWFLRYDLDSSLPIDLLQVRTKLSEFLPDSVAEHFAERFDRKQWRYCAVTFELGMSKEYERNRILPFCTKKPIMTKGGMADLWCIQVHEEFVGEDLRKAVTYSKALSPKVEDGQSYVSHDTLELFPLLQALIVHNLVV